MWPILGPGPGLSEGHFGHSFHGVYTVHNLLCRYRDIYTVYIVYIIYIYIYRNISKKYILSILEYIYSVDIIYTWIYLLS